MNARHTPTLTTDLLAFVFYGLPAGGASLNEHFMSLAGPSGLSPKFFSMLYAILYAGLLFIPAWWLHKTKIFIRL